MKARLNYRKQSSLATSAVFGTSEKSSLPWKYSSLRILWKTISSQFRGPQLVDFQCNHPVYHFCCNVVLDFFNCILMALGCTGWADRVGDVFQDKFDPSNELHKKIKAEIELGNGLPDLNTVNGAMECLKKAGFEVCYCVIVFSFKPKLHFIRCVVCWPAYLVAMKIWHKAGWHLHTYVSNIESQILDSILEIIGVRLCAWWCRGSVFSPSWFASEFKWLLQVRSIDTPVDQSFMALFEAYSALVDEFVDCVCGCWGLFFQTVSSVSPCGINGRQIGLLCSLKLRCALRAHHGIF